MRRIAVDMAKEIDINIIYGPSQEQLDAAAKEERESRCEPCCGAHEIRYRDNSFWLVTYGYDSADVAINFCPGCGKAPVRAATSPASPDPCSPSTTDRATPGSPPVQQP